MKNSLISALFVGVFLALCLCLSVTTLVFGPSESAANEQLSEKPAVKTEDGGLNTDYLSQLQSYVNDRFYLRQKLISVDRKLTGVLGVSGEDSVILGKDGWLFFEKTLADYTDTDPMSNRELFSAASNVALMEEYCKKNGKDFTFIVAPNKNSLYGQYMPDYGVTATGSNAQRFHSLLSQMEVSYVDLFAAFSQESEQLYFAHDSHWNSKGAAYGADLINAAFGVESAYYQGDFSYLVAHDGDLYGMVYPGVQDTELDGLYGGELSFSYKGPSTQADAIVLQTEGGGGGKLLCYRDSFGILLYPYLADSYAAAKFSRLVNYDLTENADYVAIELVERNLRYLIQNVPIMEAPVRDLGMMLTVSGTVEAAVDESARSPEGCSLLRGTLPQTPDADSCVYVICDGVAYEAFCLENDGFAAHVPGKATHVVYSIGGTLQMFEIQ